MKKTITKLLIVSLVILSMMITSIPAMAADGAWSITVTNDPTTTNINIAGDTFHAFQIFSANSTASYAVVDNFKDFFYGKLTDGNGQEVNFSTLRDAIDTAQKAYDDIIEAGDDKDNAQLALAEAETAYNYAAGLYLDSYSDSMSDLAMQIRTYVENTFDSTHVNHPQCDGHADAVTNEDSSESATITGLENGYYFIMDDSTTVAGLGVTASGSFVPVADSNISIAVKNSIPTLDKEIRHDDEATTDANNNLTGGWANVGDHQIGDLVEYKIATSLPKDISGYMETADNDETVSEYMYVIYDTMSEGMDLNVDSLKVYVDTNRTEELNSSYYTVYTSDDFSELATTTITAEDGTSTTLQDIVTQAGADFAIVVDVEEFVVRSGEEESYTYSYVNGSTGTVIPSLYTYYNATLNSDAVVAPSTDSNTNTANLIFSNNPSDLSGYGTDDDTVFNYTFDLDVTKVDETGAPLAGAKFALYDENENRLLLDAKDGINEYYFNGTTEEYGTTNGTDGFIVTDDTGKFTIYGLNDDEKYVLREVEAPSGYNKANDVEFTIIATYTDDLGTAISTIKSTSTAISSANNDLTTTIVNRETVILPSTGGVGTVMFQIGGAVLMLGAVALLLFKRKKTVKEETSAE
ncbi:MAG: SpaH/EbpB family LPXTG-anchored major pilin [Eubacteriales bacterium]